MSASWEVDIWGRIRRSTEAARATLLATEEARRSVWLTLVSDVAQAYFELLELDVRLQIARNSTDAYQRTYDLFLDRFNLGVASKLETSRALGALGDAQANIPSSRAISSRRKIKSAFCSVKRPHRFRAASRCTSSPWCRRCRPDCRRHSSSVAPTCVRPSSSS